MIRPRSERPEEPHPRSIRAVMLSALDSAIRAPSAHNSQPWMFGIEDDPPAITLAIDRARALPLADPLGRGLFLSCGSVLHHLRVALLARGRIHRVERMPAGRDPAVVARIRVGPARPVLEEHRALGEVIERAPAERDGSFNAPVTAALIERLHRAARELETSLTVVSNPVAIGEIRAVIDRVERLRDLQPEVRDEQRRWTPPRSAHEEALLVARRVAGIAKGEGAPMPRVPMPAHGEQPVIVLVSTPADSPLHWLRAGEALSALALSARESFVNATPLPDLIESDDGRAALARWTAGRPVQVALSLR
jgi:hypothetical protein